jgi:hypothetical protein
MEEVLSVQQINKRLKNQSYYQKNAEKHKAYVKAKAEENKDKISQQKKEYYQEHRDEIVARKEAKKEALKLKKKSPVTEESKAKHTAYMIAYVTCECGCKVQRSNTTTHKKTEKHKMILDLRSQIQK